MIILVNTSQKKELGYLEYVKPVEKITKRFGKYQVVHFLDKNILDLVKKAKKIILCGTHLKDNSFLKNMARFEFLKNFEGKVLGICSGSEIIAKVFGGKIENGCEIGLKEVEVVGNNALFEDRDKFDAYCLHCLSVELGKGFEILARSDKFIEAFKVKNKEIYGITFHPEVRNSWILERFLGV